LISITRTPFILKYQHFIENESILNSNGYNTCMTNVRSLILELPSKQMIVYATVACLSVSTILCLRDAVAATTTSTVDANIISTINLVAQNGIVFGDIASSSSPGTVTIGTNGSRTTTGGATVNTNTAGTPAKFEASGDPNAYYIVTLPDSVTITSSAGDSMTVSNFSSNPAINGQLDAGGRQDLYIGATLNVGSFQAFGAYSGIMSTTIEYN